MPQVVAINRNSGIALFDDDSCAVFEHLIDCEGELTNDRDEAVAAVVMAPDGTYEVIVLDDFTPKTLN
jgi:hypothetical protein